MKAPNQTSITAACAVLKTFTQRYGATASDTVLSNAVYSMLSVLGGPGQPAAEYADAVEQATGGEIKVKPQLTQNPDGTITIAEDNAYGLAGGVFYPESVMSGLPDEAALKKMKKADIIVQANAEGITNIDQGDPGKDELIKRLLAGRNQE